MEYNSEQLADPNSELGDVDPIYKRKQCIKKYLLKNIYDQLVRIIVEYDYDFCGKLYKTIDANDVLQSITCGIIFSIHALDDYKIAICTSGNILRILDIEKNEYTSISHKHGGIYRAVISNRNIVTIPSGVGTIDVYDQNNNCIMQISEKGLIFCTTCMLDGRIVTYAQYNNHHHQKKCMTIWNPNNGRAETVIEIYSTIECITALNNRLLVTGDSLGNIKIWDSVNGECKRTLAGHKYIVTCIAVDSAGLIISGSMDETIKIWNHDGHCINTLKGHNETIRDILVLPNGIILSQSRNVLKIWDPLKGECLSSWEIDEIINCIVLKNGLVACLSKNNKIYIYY